jgi:hypothetical protein
VRSRFHVLDDRFGFGGLGRFGFHDFGSRFGSLGNDGELLPKQ